MKRIVLLLMVVSSCGPRSAAGVILGGGVGAGMGAGMADDTDKGIRYGTAIGAGIGLLVGTILDLSSENYWACPDNEPRCLD